MKQVLFENIALLLTSLITGFGGWFFGRKKLNAEVLQAEAEAEASRIDNINSQIENAVKMLDYYKNFVDDLGTRLDSAIRELNDAKATIRELEQRIEALTDELKKYKQLNTK